jgi:DNA invertase Pin-like site-specific DNA recombinase
MRVALYLRVSTARQAEKDLSIPDQRRQLKGWCDDKGLQIVAEYVERGASATDERRPEFQRMIEDATADDGSFNVVLVHSFSRFFRDSFQFELHRRSLEKHGVMLISITQEVSEDPSGQMFRQICAMFDEYQSRENAKHVLRAMKENARQGYWNGGPPVYGYRAVTVECRADAIKKRLDIEPGEAAMVRDVFDHYLEGKGLRAIAHHLNREGLTYRKSRKFTSGLVHQILTCEAYAGTHYFNRTNAKTKQRKDPSEWVNFATPEIIERDTFDNVQARLKARRPSRTPPRIVNGPTLLTGIAKCGTCGGGMTIRTGKGGRYRYYACNNRISEGTTTCKGRNVPMAQLDDVVLEQLEKRVFAPDRLKALLESLIDRSRNKSQELAEKAKELRNSVRTIEDKIRRLYEALAEGTVTDTDIFRQTLSGLERDREEHLRLVSSLEQRRVVPSHLLNRKKLERFAAAMSCKFHAKDNSLRKAYVRQFVDRIEVDDGEVRIFGSKAALAKAVAHPDSALTTGVPNFERGWWAHKDSNLGPAD